MKNIKGGDYFTTKEVHEKFQVSRQTLYEWAQAGRLKPMKFFKDKNYYWSSKELDRQLNKAVEVVIGGGGEKKSKKAGE